MGQCTHSTAENEIDMTEPPTCCCIAGESRHYRSSQNASLKYQRRITACRCTHSSDQRQADAARSLVHYSYDKNAEG